MQKTTSDPAVVIQIRYVVAVAPGMAHSLARLVAATTALALLAFGACSSEESSGSAFETGLAGTILLAELSSEQLGALCDDVERFETALIPQRCRIEGLALARIGLLEGATDSELVNLCEAAADCEELDRAPDDVASTACLEVHPHCTSKVSDVATCYTDVGDARRDVAAILPDCSEVSRARLEALDWSELNASLTNVPSCNKVAIECSGLVPEALAFARSYCEAIAPCCTTLGIESECVLSVVLAARGQTYDAAVGQTCLDNLSPRRSEAGFCDAAADELTVVPTWPGILRACGIPCEDCLDSGPRSLENLCRGPFPA